VPIEIRDPHDRRVELYCGLRDAELRSRLEHGHGVFVVEGAHTVRRLLESRWPARSLLLRPERLAALGDMIVTADRRGVPVYVASGSVFDRIAGFPAHRGVLALGERQPDLDPAGLLAETDLAVAVEGVNDHENLGAIFRNAAAFGVGAVLLDPTCCDPLYRRAIRVSAGLVLKVPFARLSPWPAGLAELTAAGFAIVALDAGACATIESVVVRRPLALLVGAEGTGLTDVARAAATSTARIAMAAGVDSLNVATALAIALYRLSRTDVRGPDGT
jgi:tRNA G18 (ribose-2'-O)-methylase SpoU